MARRGAESIKHELEDGLNIRNLRTSEDLDKEHGNNVFSLEAGRMRSTVLKRMSSDEKGTITNDEKRFWKERMVDADQDESRLRTIVSEFEDHWRKSEEMRRQFDEQVHNAEDKGMLMTGEHEKLDETFIQQDLANKEKALQELEKELDQRRTELNKILKMEKGVMDKRQEEIQTSENWDEKLQILEGAEKENAIFQKYKKVFNNPKISKKTQTEYLEWFLTLSENEQKWALNKAEKDDIGPRTKLFDIHEGLPKDYQSPSFKEWGESRREQFLGQVDRKLDREWRKGTRDAKGILSEKSLRVLEREYEKTKKDTNQRLHRKISFSEMLKSQIKMEKKLWKEFEKFPEQVRDIEPLEQEFEEADFEERKRLLATTIPKTAARYGNALNRMNNQVDANVAENYRERFDSATTIKGKEEIVIEAEKHQASKNDYFKLWDKNKKYFNSSPDVYEKWHSQSIHNVKEARQAIPELKDMIKERENVYKGIKKLPKFMQERIDMSVSFGERKTQFEKQSQIDKQAYQSGIIPFFLKEAKEKEDTGDLNNALNQYLMALKLDPESKEIQKLAAHLKQQGAIPSLTPSSPTDAKLTQDILDKVDSQPAIQAEAADLARKQLFIDLAKKHQEQTGATGGTTKARAKASIKNLANEDKELGETIIEDQDDFTVDETGTIREKMKIKVSGEQNKETEDQMMAFIDMKLHKGDVAKTGMSEAAFMQDDGKEMEVDTANRNIQKQTEQLAAQRQHKFLTLIKADAGLNEKQLTAIREAYGSAHDDSELRDNELENLQAI
jgi:hypothetical protein